jgi:NodT family efflux transporter outer membrane factor (OMF) lipoprotein
MRKTTPLRLGSCAASIALLWGCAAVGPDFKAPTAPGASGYAMSGDMAAPQAAMGRKLAADWQGLFRSSEIDETVRLAIAGNPSLESARASLAEAHDAVLAQAARLKIDATAQMGEDRVNLTQFGFSQFPLPGGGSITLSNPTFQIYSFGLNGSYDFDLFGGKRREHEALLASAEAQGFQTDAAYLTLTAQVVSQAIAIASLRAQIAASEEIVHSDQDNLNLVSKSLQLGGVSRLDVSTVQTELATDQSTITPLRQQLAVSRHAMALLVGKSPAEWAPPDFDLDRISAPDAIPVALPSDLVRARPDIRAAEARLHVATARIGVATADLYPKLELTGQIAQGALHPQDLFSYDATGFFIGPTLTIPLFHETELKGRKLMAQDVARGAFADYRQTVLKAFVQVGDSLQAVAHDDQEIAEAERALASSTDSLRLQRLRYKDGKTGLLPVLDAQRSYARAHLNQIRARAQRLQDAAALLYAVSQGWDGNAPGPMAAASGAPVP